MLKLLRATYGLHQAPVTLKQEVIDWLKASEYIAANEAQTIWIKRTKHCLVIHAICAYEFLLSPITRLCNSMHQDFQKQLKKLLEVKSVSVYLGVDEEKFTVELNQSDYIDELPESFEMTNCIPLSTPMVHRLSGQDSGEKRAASEHDRYRNMVGSLLYLACWTRLDVFCCLRVF